ncbi:MAG: hypothetical protein IKN70_06280 [Fibrobacter sp.]|nr:hypothetical protein [Fibrobacter sp.]
MLSLFWGACENSDEPIATYGCISSKCYNSTVVTPSGKVVDIIECDNRYKFLRHPKLYYEDPEVREMMDEDLFFTEYTPTPNERCEASNCKFIGPEICYDMSYNDKNGNVHSYDICVATVDCPEKK